MMRMDGDEPMFRLTYIASTGLLAAIFLALIARASQPIEDFGRWPELKNPFESTSGGGVMIDHYAPVVEGVFCRTDFTVIIPGADGGRFQNEVVFDAVPTQGGILCNNGRWRAKDGADTGTTPFRVFIRDGIVRGSPL
jgi:hypothetical protein